MIRHYAQRIAGALATVYRRWPYSLLAVLVALTIFSVNVLLPNYRVISNARLVFLLLAGAPATMTSSSFIMLVIMSLLSGIVASIAIFTIRRQLRAATGASSILLSFIAPSCPSCAIGLAGMLGLGGLISSLPFAGKELGIIGILALLASIFYLSKKITATTWSLEKKS